MRRRGTPGLKKERGNLYLRRGKRESIIQMSECVSTSAH